MSQRRIKNREAAKIRRQNERQVMKAVAAGHDLDAAIDRAVRERTGIERLLGEGSYPLLGRASGMSADQVRRVVKLTAGGMDIDQAEDKCGKKQRGAQTGRTVPKG